MAMGWAPVATATSREEEGKYELGFPQIALLFPGGRGGSVTMGSRLIPKCSVNGGSYYYDRIMNIKKDPQ